jgi:hypothetical protein
MVFGIKRNSTHWADEVSLACVTTQEGILKAQTATDTYLSKKKVCSGEPMQKALKRLVAGLNLPSGGPSASQRFAACLHRLSVQHLVKEPDLVLSTLEHCSVTAVRGQCSNLLTLAKREAGPCAAGSLPPLAVDLVAKIVTRRIDCFSPLPARAPWTGRAISSEEENLLTLTQRCLNVTDQLEYEEDPDLQNLRTHALVPRLRRLRADWLFAAESALESSRPERWAPYAAILAEQRIDSTSGLVTGMQCADLAAWQPNWEAQRALRGLSQRIQASSALNASTCTQALNFIDYFIYRLQGPPTLTATDINGLDTALPGCGLSSDINQSTDCADITTFSWTAFFRQGNIGRQSLRLDPQDERWPYSNCSSFLYEIIAPLQEKLIEIGNQLTSLDDSVINMLAALFASHFDQPVTVARAQMLLQACEIERSSAALTAGWTGVYFENDLDFGNAECYYSDAIFWADKADLRLLVEGLQPYKIAAAENYIKQLCEARDYTQLAAYKQGNSLNDVAYCMLPPHLQALLRWQPNLELVSSLQQMQDDLHNEGTYAAAWLQVLQCLSGPAISGIPMCETTDYASLGEHLCSSLERAPLLPFEMSDIKVEVRLDPEVDSFASVGWSLCDLMQHALTCHSNPERRASLLFLLEVPELTQAAINGILGLTDEAFNSIHLLLRVASNRQASPTLVRQCLQNCGLWRPSEYTVSAAEADLAALITPVLQRNFVKTGLGRSMRYTLATTAMRPEDFVVEPEQLWVAGNHLLRALYPQETDSAACPAYLRTLWRWRTEQPAGIALCRTLLRDAPGANQQAHPTAHKFIQFLLSMQGPAVPFSVTDSSAINARTTTFFVDLNHPSASSMVDHIQRCMPTYNHLVTVGIGNSAEIMLHAENLGNVALFLARHGPEMIGGMLKIQEYGQAQGASGAAPLFTKMFAEMQDTPCFDGKLTALETLIDDLGLRDTGNVDAMLDLTGKTTKETQATEYLRVFRLRQADTYREENPPAPHVSVQNVMDLDDFNDRYITRSRFGQHLKQSPWMKGRSAADLESVLDYLIDLTILNEG